MSDIYVVLDGSRVVAASARFQGAELIRAKEARRLSDCCRCGLEECEKVAYKRLSIINTELKDSE